MGEEGDGDTRGEEELGVGDSGYVSEMRDEGGEEECGVGCCEFSLRRVDSALFLLLPGRSCYLFSYCSGI